MNSKKNDVSNDLKRVLYVFPTSHRFREPFHRLLRNKLAQHGVRYEYVYTPMENLGKGDTIEIEWAIKSRALTIRLLGKSLIWQCLGVKPWRASLIIIQQQNNLLANYWIQSVLRNFGHRVAFFGHGRNFQARSPRSLSERWKRFWATKVDWWFAYTEETADLVESYGFPREKITVFNNAIDTGSIKAERAMLNPERIESLRKSLVRGSHNVGVYVGGIYAEKRISFLLESARKVREQVPDFHLVIIGSGPDSGMIQSASEEWIHYMGPRFGVEKTELVALAKVWLMPGLVGLAVLDSFAYETPMVTCALQYHSPEFAYLVDGVNGVVVMSADSSVDYANEVIDLLVNEDRRLKLVNGAAEARVTYTIENMVDRFSEGVLAALR